MDIHTSEGAILELKPAHLGSRFLAYFIDWCIRWSIILIVLAFMLFNSVAPDLFAEMFYHGSSWVNQKIIVVFIILFFTLEWGYSVFFEYFFEGRTPGKAVIGLRVVDENGLRPGLRASIIRSMFTLFDLLPGVGLVGISAVACSKHRQRIGDHLAATLVVYDRKIDQLPIPEFFEEGESICLLPPLYYRALERYFFRRRSLFDEPRFSLAEKLCEVFIDLPGFRHSLEKRGFEASLINLFWRSTIYPQGRKSLDSAKEGPTWIEQSDLFAKCGEPAIGLSNRYNLEKHIDSLSDSVKLELFEQREVSGDSVRKAYAALEGLAELSKTLDAQYRNTELLDRLTRIYQRARRRLYGYSLQRFELVSRPLSLRLETAWGLIAPHVLLSGILFIAAVVLSYLAVSANASLSSLFLAEGAREQLQDGALWTEALRGNEAIGSASIMTNNISVSIACFVSGLSCGILTVLLIFFNGASLGGTFAALAHFGRSSGDMSYVFQLLEFISAHGFLELSIIIVSGGCGLYLGDSILRPGLQTRRQSLQTASRDILDVMLISLLSLVVAGIVEGYVSPSQVIELPVKLGFGIMLGILYWRTIRVDKKHFCTWYIKHFQESSNLCYTSLRT